ncbi:MAG: hypothetical protein V4514_06235 [Pseudomonadota bacterium]|uniref:hypothetical protein n=1 Tax=Phenylobacterium sp. TaxID=1871053 RepID=UPI0025FD5128|nr:hypothetical protein [Phenylobacterium sp.]MBT9470354.1 hypothetical protein [Phenylobacterium sp.]
MSSKLSWVTALAFTAAIAGAGAASAAPCRDAKGHFAKCSAVATAPAKAQKCHDAKGKFVKCTVSAAAPSATATHAKK